MLIHCGGVMLASVKVIVAGERNGTAPLEASHTMTAKHSTACSDERQNSPPQTAVELSQLRRHHRLGETCTMTSPCGFFRIDACEQFDLEVIGHCRPLAAGG
jgi:hypothetical protein